MNSEKQDLGQPDNTLKEIVLIIFLIFIILSHE